MTEKSPALTALLNYQQADMDGIMVLVSRQAIHEVEDEIAELQKKRPIIVDMANAPELPAHAYDAIKDVMIQGLLEGGTKHRDRAYELAVAIMGGEDAPGYAESIPTEQLVELLREERRRDWDVVGAQGQIADAQSAIELLESWLAMPRTSEGVCCCGENMETHSNPMDAGHTPVDQWDYHFNQLTQETKQFLEART